MIVNFNDKPVEILEISYERNGCEAYIMAAVYMDTQQELSAYELDILGEVYPDIIKDAFADRCACKKLIEG